MAIKKPRVKVPKKAGKGDVFTIKTMVKHPMETGRRKDKSGNPIPKNIIEKFQVDFEGQTVFSVDLETGVSSPVYFAFPYKAEKSGKFTFTWIEDTGEKASVSKDLKVG